LRNLVEELRALWAGNVEHVPDRAIVETGVLAVNSFRPNKIDASDAAKLLAAGYALLAVVRDNIDGEVPDAVLVAVANVVSGTYGLGERRGEGEAFKEAGKFARASKYLDVLTRETLPKKQRRKKLETHAGEVRRVKSPAKKKEVKPVWGDRSAGKRPASVDTKT
jgi:hypothetical protein